MSLFVGLKSSSRDTNKAIFCVLLISHKPTYSLSLSYYKSPYDSPIFLRKASHIVKTLVVHKSLWLDDKKHSWKVEGSRIGMPSSS